MWCLALPFAGGFLAYLAGRKSERARDAIAVATSIITFICIFLFCKPDIDGLSYTIALITSFVWVIATLYSLEYMKHEHKRNRFYLFLLLSLGADLGVLFSSNLIMLYLFFELLTLFSSVLVVHEESEEAIKAFKKYLYLGIAGGLSLLGGIILFYNVTGSLALDPSIFELESAGWIKYLIGAMMIAGFGVKAGIFPLHVWLPEAHPVAPTPASALLSGIMVKVGIYGIMRTILLFSPFNTTTATIAHLLLWIGLITMLVGWVLALTQDHIKKLLAYSTISQIGYIIVGIGAMGLLGAEGAIGMAGALYHVVNHAFYKSALFLIAGAIIYMTGETKMSRLGGLSREMPLLTTLAMVAFLGIIAFPGFNGFVSDTLLHHALAETSEAISAIDLKFALLLFTVNAGGTLAYYLKFITFTFFGKSKRKIEREKEKKEKIGDPPLIMLISIAALVIFIPLLGIFPDLVLESFIMPSPEGFDAHAVEHLYHMQFFTLENVTNVSISLTIGALIFCVSKRLNLMERRFAFGVDSLYNLTARSFIWLCREISGFAFALEKTYLIIARSFIWLCREISGFAFALEKTYLIIARSFIWLCREISGFAFALEKTYVTSGTCFVKFVSCFFLVERKAESAYRRAGEATVQDLGALSKPDETFFKRHGAIEDMTAVDLKALRDLEEKTCKNPVIRFAIRVRLSIGRAVGEWITLAVFLIVLMLSVYLAIFFFRVL